MTQQTCRKYRRIPCMRDKRRCSNPCWYRRRTSNRRSFAEYAYMRERLCSQLSLLIQVDASGFEPDSSELFSDSTPIARPKPCVRSRHATSHKWFGKWSYPRFCFTPSSVSKHCCFGCVYLEFFDSKSHHCGRTVDLRQLSTCLAPG